MTTANSVILPQTPYAALAQIANADTSSLKAAVTGGAGATKVAGLVASNTDASNSYTLQLVYNQGGSNSSGTVTGGTNYLFGIKQPADQCRQRFRRAAGEPPRQRQYPRTAS